MRLKVDSKSDPFARKKGKAKDNLMGQRTKGRDATEWVEENTGLLWNTLQKHTNASKRRRSAFKNRSAEKDLSE